jgi:type IV secretion system protein VirB5
MVALLRWVGLGAFLALAGSGTAWAQWAVVDVGAIAQLVQEGATLAQELATAQQELQQVQQQYQSLTGARGMEQLLAGTARNYLPVNGSELQALFAQGNSPYAALSGAMQQALSANAVLSAGQLATLTAQQQASLIGQRRTAAALQAVTADALTVTSNRFAALQQLINAIGAASDPKAVLDLQARISSEQGMLQNEQTKLAILYQAAVGAQWVNAQQTREWAVSGQGNFASRFQPAP